MTPVSSSQPAEPFPKRSSAEEEAWADMLARVSEKNARLSDALTQTGRPRTAGRRNVGRAVVQELEKERSRIARELHAGAGQPLAGIRIYLETIAGCSDSLPQTALDALAKIETLTGQALGQVRAIS